MSETPLGQTIEDNQFKETSQRKRAEISQYENPGDAKRGLLQAIGNNEITFRDALHVIRDNRLMDYPNPDKDNPREDIFDKMRLFTADRGGAIKNTYSPQAELSYIVASGVLHPRLRLPMVIEGVRQTLNYIDAHGYTDDQGGEQRKKTKVERLSNYLYALTDFQTDLIADQISASTGGNWESVRTKVVHWNEMSQQLEESAGNNPLLRSLIEKPIIRTIGKGQHIDTSPIDPMFKNKGVKDQATASGKEV